MPTGRINSSCTAGIPGHTRLQLRHLTTHVTKLETSPVSTVSQRRDLYRSWPGKGNRCRCAFPQITLHLNSNANKKPSSLVSKGSEALPHPCKQSQWGDTKDCFDQHVVHFELETNCELKGRPLSLVLRNSYARFHVLWFTVFCLGASILLPVSLSF